MGPARIVRTTDVQAVTVEQPAGHVHVRTTLRLSDGTELVFQEATVAAIVRAFVSLKTHPAKTRVELRGAALAERKAGFAEWQLLEATEEAD